MVIDYVQDQNSLSEGSTKHFPTSICIMDLWSCKIIVHEREGGRNPDDCCSLSFKYCPLKWKKLQLYWDRVALYIWKIPFLKEILSEKFSQIIMNIFEFLFAMYQASPRGGERFKSLAMCTWQSQFQTRVWPSPLWSDSVLLTIVGNCLLNFTD